MKLVDRDSKIVPIGRDRRMQADLLSARANRDELMTWIKDLDTLVDNATTLRAGFERRIVLLNQLIGSLENEHPRKN